MESTPPKSRNIPSPCLLKTTLKYATYPSYRKTMIKWIFKVTILALSLLSTLSLFIPFILFQPPFCVGLIHPNNRLIYYTMNHVLFPRKDNYITTQKSDILLFGS